MKKAIFLLVMGVLSLSLLIGCSNDENAGKKDGKVNIEFFHHKREGMETFNQLIEKFEAENPDITVEQASPPEPSTVIRTRVSKRDVPDIVAVGGDMTYKDLADAGVFMDVSDDENLEKVQPAYLQMLQDISGREEIYAIPFATNAVGVIYNIDIFEELDLTIPTTWDEFIDVAEKVKEAGQTPFYHTYKDAWTLLPSFNALAANLQGDDFYDELNKGNILAGERYREVAEKIVELANYGHNNQQGVAYNDGNTAFANGKAAMYLQGIWAIPELRKINPDLHIGVFPFPATNDTEQTKLVSGIDLILGIAETSKHKEEAMRFVEFLLEEENAQQYIDEQNAFSALEGIVQEDSSVSELKGKFESGALSDFPDHYIPTGVAPDKTLQTLIQDKDVDAFINKIQSDWEKVENRK